MPGHAKKVSFADEEYHEDYYEDVEDDYEDYYGGIHLSISTD